MVVDSPLRQTGANGVETPSGKAAAAENFPVGSFLLPARLRPHVAVYYAFARAADDIADSPDLAPADKLARLDALGKALRGGLENDPGLAKARAMRQSLAETGVIDRRCLDLLDAFARDASNPRYRDWDDLMSYCDRSAAPVGRYLLDLHGESAALYAASDALCNALQVLNHLQDCAGDYRELDRVYIPEPWLAAEGLGVEVLAEAAAPPGLRRVIDRALDGVDDLLATAAPLAERLRSRRLAMETAAILAIARRLSALLRRHDPLTQRVTLGRLAYTACMLRGLARAFSRRGPGATPRDAGAAAHVRDVAAGSGSSFYWAMRLLPRARREAMFAIYAFCRDVDDIADGDGSVDEKRLALQGWREEVGRLWEGSPETAIGRALLDAKTRYRLDRADLQAVIDGVEMDAAWSARAPDRATLELYCSRVAGAVGLLSIKVFGDDSHAARRGALALGQAMQFTNILRDLAEDAARGRLYLPRELLGNFGIPPGDPASVIGHPEVARVCETLADAAEKYFGEAARAFASCDRKAMRPARAMMAVYRLLLRRLRERGWSRLAERPRIARVTKLWLTLRHGLF